MPPGTRQNARLSGAARRVATSAKATGPGQERRRNLLTAACLGLFVVAVTAVGAWHVTAERSGEPSAAVTGQ